MSHKTRAKFKVQSIMKTEHYNGGGKEMATVRLYPVYKDGSEENKQFWEATPNGSIEIAITNPESADVFKLGKEYYVDFTLAD